MNEENQNNWVQVCSTDVFGNKQETWGQSPQDQRWLGAGTVGLRHDSVQCQRRALLQVWMPKVTGFGFHYTRAIVIL